MIYTQNFLWGIATYTVGGQDSKMPQKLADFVSCNVCYEYPRSKAKLLGQTTEQCPSFAKLPTLLIQQWLTYTCVHKRG